MDFFQYHPRLGISIPYLVEKWDEYPQETKELLLFQWEKIRGTIPDRIADLEHDINKKQAALSDEANFQKSCQLNHEIAELASIINELWLWYRTHQDMASKGHI